jgi:Bacterial regulatory protein, Fis family
MTAQGMEEGGEDSRRQSGEGEGIPGTVDKGLERAGLQWLTGSADVGRTESERPAAAQVDPAGEAGQPPAWTPGLGLKEVSRQTARAVESVIIKYVLAEVRGNRVEAARRLQISYKALLYKIEMYQLGDSRPARRLDAHLARPRPESRSAATNGHATPSPPGT